jgi:4-hydroxy-tetrahydrodipicolinate reductase
VVRLPERVRIGVVGLGWIGQEVVRAAMEDARVQLVGMADSDPAKAGRDIGEILGEGRLGIPIDKSVTDLLARARPEVAVLCTTSDVTGLAPTIDECLAHGAHVVTTCENLADPEVVEGLVGRAIDERARKKGVVVLATGVNPGFAMDRLPIMLTQATRNIRRVRVVRVVDASTRRAQLQMKVGIGLSAKQFSTAMKTGAVGHQGLSASMRIIAKGLGVSLDKTSEALRPLIAEYPTRSSVLGPVDVGRVRGIYQVARGYRGRRELITLEVIIALDEPNSRDSIDIVGEPPIHFQGELPGDACTVATVLSAIPVVVTMPSGLRTVLDVPLEQPEEPASSAQHRLLVQRSATTTELPRPSPVIATTGVALGAAPWPGRDDNAGHEMSSKPQDGADAAAPDRGRRLHAVSGPVATDAEPVPPASIPAPTAPDSEPVPAPPPGPVTSPPPRRLAATIAFGVLEGGGPAVAPPKRGVKAAKASAIAAARALEEVAASGGKRAKRRGAKGRSAGASPVAGARPADGARGVPKGVPALARVGVAKASIPEPPEALAPGRGHSAAAEAGARRSGDAANGVAAEGVAAVAAKARRSKGGRGMNGAEAVVALTARPGRGSDKPNGAEGAAAAPGRTEAAGAGRASAKTRGAGGREAKARGATKGGDAKARGAKAGAAKAPGAKAPGAKAPGAKARGAKAPGAKRRGARARGGAQSLRAGAKRRGARARGAQSWLARAKTRRARARGAVGAKRRGARELRARARGAQSFLAGAARGRTTPARAARSLFLVRRWRAA